MTRSPDFLCVGTQKACTTWLDSMLRMHPDLWLPPIKELQYFNEIHIPGHKKWTQGHRLTQCIREMSSLGQSRSVPAAVSHMLAVHLRETQVNDDWYLKIFSIAPSDSVCGEITPDYAILPERGIQHILEMSPSVRVLLMLRDPIERAWSHVRMLLKSSPAAKLETLVDRQDILQRGQYKSMLERWENHVSPARLLVQFADDVQEHPERVIRRICDFLGVSVSAARFGDLNRTIHKGEPRIIDPAAYAKWKHVYEPDIRYVAARFPNPAGSWLRRHFDVEHG